MEHELAAQMVETLSVMAARTKDGKTFHVPKPHKVPRPGDPNRSKRRTSTPSEILAFMARMGGRVVGT